MADLKKWKNQPEGEVIFTRGITEDSLEPAAGKRAGGDVSAILAAIAAKEVTSLQVVDRMIQRAEDCTAYTNCVVKGPGVDLYAAARSTAAEHDKAEHPKGPLHGLPFSVKECYLLEGTDSTIGLQKQTKKPSTKTAGLIRQLTALGAIPFVKTNIPQIMYSFECSNPVYGYTSNPHHRAFCPGGSSGGEGCLISQGGSPFGIGTDIGGSCRIPAHMSGCCGLKFTQGRVSVAGKGPHFVYGTGQQIIASCPGVLAQQAKDLAAVLPALLSKEALDHTREAIDSSVVPAAWDAKVFSEFSPQAQGAAPARVIGWYDYDGYLEASPLCTRAVLEAKTALEAAGHQLVPFTPPRIPRLVQLYYGLLACGSEHISNALDGEETAPFLANVLKSAKTPGCLLSILSCCLRSSAPKYSAFLDVVGSKSAGEYYDYVSELQLYKAEFKDAMRQAGVDLLLAPVHCLPACPHDSSMDMTQSACYSMVYNAIDYPAGTVKVTSMTNADHDWPVTLPLDSKIDASIRAAYQAAVDAAVPFPAGVQIVGLPFEEEKVLGMLMQLEDALANGTNGAAAEAESPTSKYGSME